MTYAHPVPVAVRRPLRYEPPDLDVDLVARARLIPPLRGRFERLLTVVTAGAGFGKTTVLSQAVAENRIDRWGTDAWLQLQPADRQPRHLLAGIARAISGADRTEPTTVGQVIDLLLGTAPTEVALILDDTAVLGEEREPWEAVAELLARLPANAHLVLAGRTPPPLSVTRLVASGDALVLTETDLAFRPEELAELGRRRHLDPSLVAELPAWPALATLQGQVGHAASTAFVWEEVLAPMPPERLRLLALAAPFELIDDDLLAALEPPGATSAAALVDGLPLVQRDGRGAFRVHALFGEALERRIEPTERRLALADAARRLLEAGADRRAIEAAALAGDDDVLRAATCSYLRQGFRALAVPDVLAIRARLPPALRSQAVGTLVDAAVHWGTDGRQAMARFAAAEEQARREGDREVEALAGWRHTQLRYLDDPDTLRIEPRHQELADEGVALGRSIVAFIRSVEAQRSGDPDAAIAALDDLDATDPVQRHETTIVRHFDLGRPEAALATLDAPRRDGEPNLFAAQSLWLCASVPVELVWELARTLPDAGGRAGVAHEQVSLLSIVAMVASQRGEDAVAADVLERARPLVPAVGRGVQGLYLAASAVHELAAVDEATGRARLDELLELIPLGAFPQRPHLYVLGPLRALVPEAAAVDRLDLGPTFALAVAAGAAIDAGRQGDGGRAAAALPWSRVEVLRANLPPPLVAELALLAASAGATAALTALDRLPHPQRWLASLRSHPAAGVAAAAAARAELLPARPAYDVELTLLGAFGVHRSDGVLVDATRASRVRVRQLLGRLALRRSIGRAELAADLWPDLPPDKAITNLRTNLHHLQALLQPERAAGSAPWFVRTGGEAIALCDEGLSIDLHRFEDHLRAANELESSGLPSRALVDLRAACDLYRGDLLPGLDDREIDLERIRLRSLAIAARCRAGELVMARGEPEAAMHDAVAALRMEPASERATRLFVRCHLAIGATTEARRLLRDLLGELAGQRLRPEAETTALARHLGVEA